MTSRAFIDLEKRSRAINRKRYFRIFIILFFIFIACAFAYIEFMKLKQPILKKNILVEKKIPKIKKLIVDINVTKVIKPKVLKPKVNKTDIKKIERYDTVFLKPTITIPKIKKLEIKNNKIKKKITIPKIKEQLAIAKEENKVKIIVKSFDSEDSLLKKNKANENFKTTLNLSKYYFEKSKFEKAIVWSKKANHYKASSFEPWLIYAKAKIKQNKKDEAIKAVETFLSYYDSDVAQKFLQDMKRQK